MFGNLECAVSSSPTRRKLPVTLRANPKAVAAFTGLPPLVLSVANNHSLDCGAQGLTDTIASLRSEGIHAVGGGPSLADAQRPVIMPVNGLRIAVVAFSEFSAIRQVPGATISPATVPSVRETVSRAAKQADVVVASFHWGIEGQQTPTDHQRALARAAVASGAILVIGSHPHVLQGLEWLPARHGRRALVAYSLGNFVFDSRRQEMNRTAILRVTFERNSIKLAEFVPVVIQHGCPHPATPDEAARILTLVSHFSSKFGAKVNGTGELKSLR
jgi:poly-gamma-glutamate synthesis protein (capsule biosynthesis protein)